MSRGIGAQQTSILGYLEEGPATTDDLAWYLSSLRSPNEDDVDTPTESEKSSIRRSLRSLEQRGHATRNRYIWTLA